MKVYILCLLLLLLSLSVTLAKKKKEEPFEPITEMRRVTPKVIEAERDGSFDKQVVYVIFREAYVQEKGLVELVNQFKLGLHRKGVKPNEFVQINEQKVGVVVTSITDMMEIKEVGKTRKSILMIKSGEERIIGAHVTKEEKDKLYDQIQGKYKRRKPKKTEEKEDL